jgi:HK97 gp10 family phage protein
MGVTVKFRNKDRLFQNMKKTVPAIDDNLRKALAKSGDEFVAKAKSLVPREYGDAEDSIKWQWTKNTQASSLRSPAIAITAGGDDAFYVRFIEFGTAGHEQGGLYAGTHHPGSAPQPFFYPSYRILRTRIKGRLSRAVTGALKKAGF